jgi:hypothetical protein
MKWRVRVQEGMTVYTAFTYDNYSDALAAAQRMRASGMRAWVE